MSTLCILFREVPGGSSGQYCTSLCAFCLLDPLIPGGGPGQQQLPSLILQPDNRNLLSVSLDLPLLDTLCSKDSHNTLPGWSLPRAQCFQRPPVSYEAQGFTAPHG